MSPESPAPREPGIQMIGALILIHFCCQHLFIISVLISVYPVYKLYHYENTPMQLCIQRLFHGCKNDDF